MGIGDTLNSSLLQQMCANTRRNNLELNFYHCKHMWFDGVTTDSL